MSDIAEALAALDRSLLSLQEGRAQMEAYKREVQRALQTIGSAAPTAGSLAASSRGLSTPLARDTEKPPATGSPLTRMQGGLTAMLATLEASQARLSTAAHSHSRPSSAAPAFPAAPLPPAAAPSTVAPPGSGDSPLTASQLEGGTTAGGAAGAGAALAARKKALSLLTSSLSSLISLGNVSERKGVMSFFNPADARQPQRQQQKQQQQELERRMREQPHAPRQAPPPPEAPPCASAPEVLSDAAAASLALAVASQASAEVHQARARALAAEAQSSLLSSRLLALEQQVSSERSASLRASTIGALQTADASNAATAPPPQHLSFAFRAPTALQASTPAPPLTSPAPQSGRGVHLQALSSDSLFMGSIGAPPERPCSAAGAEAQMESGPWLQGSAGRPRPGQGLHASGGPKSVPQQQAFIPHEAMEGAVAREEAALKTAKALLRFNLSVPLEEDWVEEKNEALELGSASSPLQQQQQQQQQQNVNGMDGKDAPSFAGRESAFLLAQRSLAAVSLRAAAAESRAAAAATEAEAAALAEALAQSQAAASAAAAAAASERKRASSAIAAAIARAEEAEALLGQTLRASATEAEGAASCLRSTVEGFTDVLGLAASAVARCEEELSRESACEAAGFACEGGGGGGGMVQGEGALLPGSLPVRAAEASALAASAAAAAAALATVSSAAQAAAAAAFKLPLRPQSPPAEAPRLVAPAAEGLDGECAQQQEKQQQQQQQQQQQRGRALRRHAQACSCSGEEELEVAERADVRPPWRDPSPTNRLFEDVCERLHKGKPSRAARRVSFCSAKACRERARSSAPAFTGGNGGRIGGVSAKEFAGRLEGIQHALDTLLTIIKGGSLY